jgi:phytoene synthase
MECFAGASRGLRSMVVASLDQTSDLEAAYARCAHITRSSSSNFYYAFMLLPAARRRAIYAVYAFCRFVDDIADDAGGPIAPAVLLDRWRDELNKVYASAVERPVSRALAHSVHLFNIPQRHFEAVIDGVAMDLTQRRYATFDDLRPYCYRVASAVGLICIEIFGYRNPATKLYAERLGIAFQLTNIIRDVKEDAERNRIYLPLEDLRRFGVTEEDILQSVHTPGFKQLMEFETARARDFYREADAALAPEDRPAMLPAEGMRLIYSALLERIARSGYRVFDGRLRVSAPRKLYLVGRAWAGSRFARAS